ncbi:hypothetical protein [Hoeflea sp. 108]|jgi:hypothetical protein|uniref:DUF6950 family protein n=1 Tax=Hoeflea sp. 108 TaxID=1116369 RepID=UPI000371C82B|nr:hypothetical protein [Hoeflea sp. 108]
MHDWKAEVSAFIASESEKPFAWGLTDCATTADRWVCGVLGASPLRIFGRMHSDEAEAHEWLEQPGGIAVAVNRVCRSAGLRKAVSPEAGDVGLIIHGQKLCVAIHAGEFWFSRDADGLIGASLASLFKAWKVV